MIRTRVVTQHRPQTLYLELQLVHRHPQEVLQVAPYDYYYLVPLRTGTCYIRDIFVLFVQDYCALQELLTKMNFTTAVAPPLVHPMTTLPATPTHSVQKYGFFGEPTRRRQVAKYGNLKRCESVIFW